MRLLLPFERRATDHPVVPLVAMDDRADPPSTSEIDAAYPGIPSPTYWGDLAVATTTWDQTAARLSTFRSQHPGTADALRERAFREAGFDSGAIEGLYTTDSGFTLGVAEARSAEEGARLVREHKGTTAEELFRAQLDGLHMALDLVTGRRPLTQAWVRELHSVVVAPQGDYEVSTPLGPQRHALPKGAYKHQPNHVLQRDGSVFAYAPVDLVAQEMARFVDLAGSSNVSSLHPITAAAWLHYALVRIHPFADGNGRVSRIVASIPLLRATSTPLVVPADRRDRYLAALRAVDDGRPEVFVRFIADESTSTLRLLAALGRERAARAGIDPSSALEALDEAAGTVADEAAVRLRDAAHGILLEEFLTRGSPATMRAGSNLWLSRADLPAGWRRPIEESAFPRGTQVRSGPPLHVRAESELMVLVPEADTGTIDLLLRFPDWPDLDELVSLSEIEPRIAGVLTTRLQLWATVAIDRLLVSLIEAATERRATLHAEAPDEGPSLVMRLVKTFHPSDDTVVDRGVPSSAPLNRWRRWLHRGRGPHP